MNRISPSQAYDTALQTGGSDELRSDACQDPMSAFLYARDIDKKPSLQTRAAASKSSDYAHFYAVHVDQKITERTMRGVIKNEVYAFYYFMDLNNGILPEWLAKVPEEHLNHYNLNHPALIVEA